MNRYNVEHTEEGVFIRTPDNVLLAVKMGGQLVRAFNVGWSSRRVYDGAAPILMLELQHADGHQATWFLDEDMNRLTDRPSELTGNAREYVRTHGLSIMTGLWRNWICASSPIFESGCNDFLSLAPGTRDGIYDLCVDEIATTPSVISLEQARISDAAMEKFASTLGAAGARFNPAIARQSFEMVPSVAILDGVGAGAIAFRSIIDGDPAYSRVSVTTDAATRFLYRIDDIRNKLSYFAVVLHDHCRYSAVYFPGLDCLLVPNNNYENLIKDMFSSSGKNSLKGRILWLVMHFGAAFGAYLDRGAASFAMPVRGNFHTHLGVYIWSVLTGVEQVVQRINVGAPVPQILIGAEPDAEEKFGPLDDLFPEIVPHARRGFASFDALTQYCLERYLAPVQVASQRVGRLIGERVVEHALTRPDFSGLRDQAAELRRQNYLVVLLGIRVENRTDVDQAELFIHLAQTLRRYVGKLAVIIDGHNVTEHAKGRVYPSDYQNLATGTPIEHERAVAEAIKTGLSDRDIMVIDAVGVTMSEAIFWCAQADFFVCMWGAGLAKYRWICHQSGLIITSRWNLANRGDLHIYDADRFFESDKPVEFLPENFVEDLPEAKLLFPVTNFPPESIWNFRADREEVSRRAVAMIPASKASVP